MRAIFAAPSLTEINFIPVACCHGGTHSEEITEMFTVWFVVAMFTVFAAALAYADIAENLRRK